MHARNILVNSYGSGDGAMPYVAPGFSLAAFVRIRHDETFLRDHGKQPLPRDHRDETCRSEERLYKTISTQPLHAVKSAKNSQVFAALVRSAMADSWRGFARSSVNRGTPDAPPFARLFRQRR